MSVELNILTTELVRAVAVAARRSLRTQCLPTAPGGSVDHVEVVDAEITVAVSGPALDVRVPADVFVVTDAEVAATPNAAPPGALSPAARVVLPFRLSAQVRDAAGTQRPRVEIAAQPPQGIPPGVPWPGAGPVPLGGADLTPLFATLALPMPTSGDVSLAGDVTVVRFDGQGPSVAHLGVGDEWQLFLPVAAWQQVITARVGAALAGSPTGAVIEGTSWRGTPDPVLDVRVGTQTRITLESPLGDISSDVHMWAELECTPALVPTVSGTRLLRVTVAWSAHVTAEGVPGFLEAELEDRAAEQLDEVLDPASFGAAPAGSRRFAFDVPLPALVLADAALRADALLGLADGAGVGGQVLLRTLGQPAFGLEPARLSKPLRLQLCSVLARSGSGAPSREPQTLANSATVALVRVHGAGRLCGSQLLSSGPALDGYVSVTTSAGGEDVDVRVRIPYTRALGIIGPVRMLVRTSRGVRMLDLGTVPAVQLDAAGTVLNGFDWFIDDCLQIVPGEHEPPGGRWGSEVDAALGVQDSVTTDRFRPPPLEDPGWATFVAQGGGLSVQLVTLDELVPGEIVRFRSATHTVDVSADERGRAVVPVLLSLELPQASIERVSRLPLPERVRVEVVDLEHRASFVDLADDVEWAVASGGELVRTSVLDGRRTAESVGFDGTRRRLDGSADELNPQPLPPGPAPDAPVSLNPQPLPPGPDDLRRALGLVVREVLPVPGFATSPVAIAVLEDGATVLIDVHRDGAVRVSGTLSGPVGRVARLGSWAVVTGDGREAVLAVQGQAREVPSDRAAL